MDNEKLKKQLRDMCIAADGLATAMHLFYANVSSDILDDIIAQAEKENRQQEELDRWVNMKRTIETPCGPVKLVDLDKVTKDELDAALHHCGQDCDCDDACCQAGSPCGRSAVTYDPNESQPVDVKPAITGESLYKLLGRQVICFLKPGESRCDNCQFNPDDPEDCVKVELVGGYYLCLAPLPNTVNK